MSVHQVHVCKATTLPEVLSDFWSLTAEYAQAKYAAMADDRDYAAHLLFVAADCDLLKDYGMMRQLVRERQIDNGEGGPGVIRRTIEGVGDTQSRAAVGADRSREYSPSQEADIIYINCRCRAERCNSTLPQTL